MTTYTFKPSDSTVFANWDDPTMWFGGVVPNSADADVVIPLVNAGNTAYSSIITIKAGESFTAASVVITQNYLVLNGSLSVQGAVSLLTNSEIDMSGGTLTVGALQNTGFDIQGSGTINSPNALTNLGKILGITINATGFTNSSGGVLMGGTLNITPGGFTNLSGTTLTKGVYESLPGYALKLNVGNVITTDAAVIIDSADTFESYDPASGTYRSLQSTLQTIASRGVLETASYTTTSLTVDGTLMLIGAATPFTANQLTVGSGGKVNGSGTITASIANDGLIESTPQGGINYHPGNIKIIGDVTGSGLLEVGPALFQSPRYVDRGTLELDGGTSESILFADSHGTLTLDQPTAFSGTLAPNVGNAIDLVGIAFSSVTGESYSGDQSGGTLTIDEGGTSISIKFAGAFNTSSFVLSVGPQLLSIDPPSLAITVGNGKTTGNAFAVDGSHGVQHLVGTGNRNFINAANAAGTGTLLVDLKDGYVSKGSSLDATLQNIQGVQLGADPAVVLGLASGTDLIYGGSGPDQFYNGGGTDYILGSTTSNAIVGGTGATTFYGNGGIDDVHGGSGAIDLIGGSGTEELTGGSGTNQLVGSSQSVSAVNVLNGGTGTDVFYAGIGTNLFYEGSGVDVLAGNAGTDYVYGGAGKSFVYGGTGTEVIATGAGNQYVRAGSGHTYFSDTSANLTAGRVDWIDNFAGGQGTELYLPKAVQGATKFVQQNGGTAVLTAVGGGTAEIFAGGADLATVQTHTHFTL